MTKFISIILLLFPLSCNPDVKVLGESTEPITMPFTVNGADWRIVCRGDEVWTEFKSAATDTLIPEAHIKDSRSCEEVEKAIKEMEEWAKSKNH